MSIKEFIEQIGPDIKKNLPNGSFKNLEREHDLSRQSLSVWFKGKYGEKNEERCLDVIDSVVKILKESGQANIALSIKIKNGLKKIQKKN